VKEDTRHPQLEDTPPVRRAENLYHIQQTPCLIVLVPPHPVIMWLAVQNSHNTYNSRSQKYSWIHITELISNTTSITVQNRKSYINASMASLTYERGYLITTFSTTQGPSIYMFLLQGVVVLLLLSRKFVGCCTSF
jgi:hypothetical protein